MLVERVGGWEKGGQGGGGGRWSVRRPAMHRGIGGQEFVVVVVVLLLLRCGSLSEFTVCRL